MQTEEVVVETGEISVGTEMVDIKDEEINTEILEFGEVGVQTEGVIEEENYRTPDDVGKDEEINTDILNYWSSCSLTDSIVNYKTI